MKLTDEQKWQAVAENNVNYDGTFYYAVKSTGIFCKPSCNSRLPKRTNVEFYDTAQKSQQAGYRACKRCRSDLQIYQPAKDIANELKVLLDNLFLEKHKIDAEIKKLGLSQRRVIDVFKEEYGITPKVYIDYLRLEEAKKMLAETDEDILNIALSVGFNSLSAFYNFFKTYTSMTPKAYRRGKQENELCNL